MLNRIVVALGALLMGSSALVGVQYSGATWTHASSSPITVSAAHDWTPPEVTLDALPIGVAGATVTVHAQATDERSEVASLTLEYAAAGTDSWTAFSTCTTGTAPVSRTCTWNTTVGVPDGDYLVRATATDTAGYSATAVETTSVVNNAATVLDPIPASVRGSVTLTGQLYNSGSGGTQLTMDYRSGGTGAWTQICARKQNPLTCTWSTGAPAVPDGTYEVRIWASSGPSDSQVVVVDNTAPTTTLSAPASPLFGTVTLTAVPADLGSGIAKVAFAYAPAGTDPVTGSWTSCGTDTTAPYTCEVNTSGLSGGYDFRAIATDAAVDGAGVGNQSAPVVVTRSVDNTPQSVGITSPAAGATVDGTIQVAVAATSPYAVSQVRVEARALPSGSFATVCTDGSAPYSCGWDTSTLGNGGYELRAVMVQGNGVEQQSSPRAVTVDHSVGSVAITSPATGSTLTNQAAVTVSGTTSSQQGVTSVRLRATPTNPAGATTTTDCTLGAGTFSCAWDTSAVVWREFDLLAEMKQGNGVTVTSLTPVHVKIDNMVGTVGMTSPTAGSYVGGTTTLSATATTNGSVTGLVFESRPTPSGSFTTACTVALPVGGSVYSCDWSTAGANGAHEVRAVMTLSSGKVVTSAAVVTTVVNLKGVDVQAGDQSGQLNSGDTLTFTYSHKVDYGSIKAGFTGASTTVGISVGGSARTMTFTGARLGTVTFAQSYFKKTFTLDATMTATDVSGVTVVTVTLPSTSNGNIENLTTATGAMTWAPDAAVTDALVHKSCSTAVVTESGPLDKDL